MEIKGNANKTKTFMIGRAALVLVVLTMCFVTVLKAAEPIKSTVAVIANKDVAENEMKQKDVEALFLGKVVQWSNKKKVTVYTLKSGDVHKNFLKDYVNSTSAKFKSYWKKKVFTGEADAPKEFKKEKDMINQVAKTKGAIGYVSADFLKKNPDLVKSITVTK